MSRLLTVGCAVFAILAAFPLQAAANDDPEITSFGAQQIFGDLWLFSGTVDDEDPESCIVDFGGLLAQYATVAADGTFQLLADIVLPGIVTATAEDSSSSLSDVEEVYVDP